MGPSLDQKRTPTHQQEMTTTLITTRRNRKVFTPKERSQTEKDKNLHDSIYMKF